VTLSVVATAGGVATACLGTYVAYLAYDGHRFFKQKTAYEIA
jgi:hypothetical protein